MFSSVHSSAIPRLLIARTCSHSSALLNTRFSLTLIVRLQSPDPVCTNLSVLQCSFLCNPQTSDRPHLQSFISTLKYTLLSDTHRPVYSHQTQCALTWVFSSVHSSAIPRLLIARTCSHSSALLNTRFSLTLIVRLQSPDPVCTNLSVLQCSFLCNPQTSDRPHLQTFISTLKYTLLCDTHRPVYSHQTQCALTWVFSSVSPAKYPVISDSWSPSTLWNQLTSVPS